MHCCVANDLKQNVLKAIICLLRILPFGQGLVGAAPLAPHGIGWLCPLAGQLLLAVGLQFSWGCWPGA